MRTIGERLKTERERLRLTQEKLAEYGGVLKRSQVNYEKGDRFPDAKYLEGVAKASVDVLYVLTGKHSESPMEDMPTQRQGAPTHQIEEMPARYDLGASDEKSQNDTHTLKLHKAEMETLKAEAEAAKAQTDTARKEAEIAKAQARAEIAEARLEILQPQAENFKLVRDLLKRTQAQLERTEARLTETEKVLNEMQADVTSIKKNSQRAA